MQSLFGTIIAIIRLQNAQKNNNLKIWYNVRLNLSSGRGQAGFERNGYRNMPYLSNTAQLLFQNRIPLCCFAPKTSTLRYEGSLPQRPITRFRQIRQKLLEQYRVLIKTNVDFRTKTFWESILAYTCNTNFRKFQHNLPSIFEVTLVSRLHSDINNLSSQRQSS